MADLTNTELAERLDAVQSYLAKIAEAFLLGQSATPLHVYGPANDGDAVQVFSEAAEAAEVAAARLRKPLQFRWEQDHASPRYWRVYAGAGDMCLGSVIRVASGRWQWARLREGCHQSMGSGSEFESKEAAMEHVEREITSQVTGGGR